MRRGEMALLELIESAGARGSVERLRAVVRIASAAAGAQRLDDVIELVAEEACVALAVARLGGDEFSVVLPERSLAAASQLAREASRVVARELQGQPMLSSGAAAREGRAIEPSELLRAADAAQYAAKRLGGGRLKLSSATDRPALVAMEPLDRRALRSQRERQSTSLVARVVEAFDEVQPRSALDGSLKC